ncbi:MAG: beta-N-acetylhexosaminidase [Kiritimatiellae bacterium]|nr:beta-N-acetylhexosaminidase [Kiritimatiellia bacterium]
MKRLMIAATAGWMAACAFAEMTLVPAPQACSVQAGSFELATNEISAAVVAFTRDAAVPKEGYRLTVAADGIRVAHSDEAGAFYALKTLEQLAEPKGKGLVVPCVSISDAPAFAWRGVHFDDCRHFFGKQTLKRVLDLMAAHKMNVLHWHLTEDQGWRLDVPGYPDLVKYGAVRPASPAHGAMMRRLPNGERDMALDGLQYGPFYYTEADVKEIVAYAAARHIMVVPEIELPGHVYAALAAYPQFACRPENLAHRHPRLIWGIEKDVLCLGNDAALKFMDDVLDYVCRLFPAPYVHIGGDECPSERWKDCPKCRARMAAEGLTSEKDLQPWVTRRYVKYLEARGKRVIGWDEYLNGDVPKSAVGMSWRTAGGNGAGHKLVSGAEGAMKGHDMIMTPHDQTYFYYGQGLPDDPFQYGGSGRPYGGGKLTLEKTYAFDPLKGVPSEAQAHILGGQCCNWSEYTWNEYDLAWKMWPRGCAMAETLWLGAKKPGYADFYARMTRYRQRLLAAGVTCAPMPPAPQTP